MNKKFFIAAFCIVLLNLVVLLIIILYFLSSQIESNQSAMSYMLAHTPYVGTVTACFIGCGAVSFLILNQITKPIKQLEKQLREAEDENKRVEHIRSEFVANVTHELKTPLTSIAGFIETLKDGAAENPEVRNKFLDIIEIETSRLKRLIEDILILSDIENRKTATDDKNFNIQDGLKGILDTIKPIAESKNVSLRINLEENCSIKGDEDRFAQMMLNLIDNAVKYSNDDGQVRVDSFSEGDNIIITVSDDGIGIDEEHFDRIFERFYRVDKSRTKKVGGTGLGLSIVKHIAALFDAEITFESKLEKGTTFKIKFKKA